MTTNETNATPAVQTWAEWSDDDAKADKASLNQGDLFKIPQGRTVLRFLPVPMGRAYRSPFIIAHTHYVTMPGAEKGVQVQCLQRTSHLPCPVCQKSEELKGTGNGDDYEAGKELEPRTSVYACVIVRDQEAMGPQVITMAQGIYKDLLAIRDDPDAGVDFVHPMKGVDIVINRTGEKKGTKYKVTPATKVRPLENLDWIGLAPDMTRYTKKWSLAEVRAKLQSDPDIAGEFASVLAPPAPAGRQLPSAQGRPATIAGAATRVVPAQGASVEDAQDKGDAEIPF